MGGTPAGQRPGRAGGRPTAGPLHLPPCSRHRVPNGSASRPVSAKADQIWAGRGERARRLAPRAGRLSLALPGAVGAFVGLWHASLACPRLTRSSARSWGPAATGP